MRECGEFISGTIDRTHTRIRDSIRVGRGPSTRGTPTSDRKRFAGDSGRRTRDFLIAYSGTKAILRTLPQALPRAHEVGLDFRVVLFTLGVSLLVGMLFGLAPALKLSRTSVAETLKEGGRGWPAAQYGTKRKAHLWRWNWRWRWFFWSARGLMIRSLTGYFLVECETRI